MDEQKAMQQWEHKSLQAQSAADVADFVTVVWIIHSALVFMEITVNIGLVVCQRSCFLPPLVSAAKRWWMVKNTTYLCCCDPSGFLLTFYLFVLGTPPHCGSWKFYRLVMKGSSSWNSVKPVSPSSWKQGKASKLMQYALQYVLNIHFLWGNSYQACTHVTFSCSTRLDKSTKTAQLLSSLSFLLLL